MLRIRGKKVPLLEYKFITLHPSGTIQPDDLIHMDTSIVPDVECWKFHDTVISVSLSKDFFTRAKRARVVSFDQRDFLEFDAISDILICLGRHIEDPVLQITEPGLEGLESRIGSGTVYYAQEIDEPSNETVGPWKGKKHLSDWEKEHFT